MSTLLMRLAAPLQSWGIDSKFDRRDTARAPTKSGIIGLVAAALGRRRNDSVDDLRELRFGVRVDREGTLLRDYHTVESKKPYVTHRYYLADAVFLVGLEGKEDLLIAIEHALSHPRFPLFLGRRSCPPEGRLSLGLRNNTLLDALREEPWQVSRWLREREDHQISLSILTDTDQTDTNTYFQRDVPLSYDQVHRRFGFRRVCIRDRQTVVNSVSSRLAQGDSTQHDPMRELEGV